MGVALYRLTLSRPAAQRVTCSELDRKRARRGTPVPPTDGRQVQKEDSARRGRGAAAPPAGYLIKRQAEERLRGVLEQAGEGRCPGMVRTAATVAQAPPEVPALCPVPAGSQAIDATGATGRSSKRGLCRRFGGSIGGRRDVTSARWRAWIHR